MGCALLLATPAGSSAAVLAPWGSSLSATPTLDTANGASTQFTNMEPASSFYRDPTRDTGIWTDFTEPCKKAFPAGPGAVKYLHCTHWMHDGADIAVWNTQLGSGSPTAPAGGQVLYVKVKGCTVEDTSSPVQYSQAPGQDPIPVGSIEFQDLRRNSDGSFTSRSTAGTFQVPFCSHNTDPASGPTNTSTVTTYQPVHFCIDQQDTVGIFQSGGFVPSGTAGAGGGPWYPQGAPVMILAPGPGSGMSSFADADLPNKSNAPTYSPGAQPLGNNSGWGQEPNQEVMLQVIEGVGDDAYGQCPGGHAVEPANSNTVICVTHSTNPGDPYGTCNAQLQPVFPPQNTAPPTIRVSSSGSPVTGAPVPGNRIDVTHGSWTNNPYGYHEQWVDCDSNGTNCAPISGATNPYYYITNSDVGHTIEVQETASNQANTEGPVSSAPTAIVVTRSGAGGAGGGSGGTGGGGTGGGGTSGGGGGGIVSPTIPRAAALSVSPRKFALTGRRVKGHCVATSRANRRNHTCTRTVALRLSYKLTIPARVSFTIKRQLSGRLVNGRCVKPVRKNRRRRHCTRLVPVRWTLTRAGSAGTNTFVFYARIGGHTLGPGTYQLTATPTAGGHPGKTRAASFKILP